MKSPNLPWRGIGSVCLFFCVLALPLAADTPQEEEARKDQSDVPTGEVDERFADLGEYIKDKTTGLYWQKDGTASGKLNFFQAADYAKGLKLGGLSGWRVPTKEELAGVFPAVAKPFVNTPYTKEACCMGPHEWNSYWTSDLDKRLDDYAYVYHWYAAGGANNCFASKNYVYVRCVRDSK